MANRINPIAAQLKIPGSSQKKSLKVSKESDQTKIGELETGGKSTAVVPWATAAGHSLYEKVQKLPDSGTTGSPDKTSPDKETAKEQGVGREVDRYA